MTNFHLPRSTLFMLVSALMGPETMPAAYAQAIGAGCRFYSYGDASLLVYGTWAGCRPRAAKKAAQAAEARGAQRVIAEKNNGGDEQVAVSPGHGCAMRGIAQLLMVAAVLRGADAGCR